MADQVDDATETEESRMNAILKDARKKAAAIPRGEPGDCDLCGEYTGRLVHGVCAPCRDRYHLK